MTIRRTSACTRSWPASTGTALTEANEFHEIYTLEVVPIPTHRPIVATRTIRSTAPRRRSSPSSRTSSSAPRGRPAEFLVGTISVEVSEHPLSPARAARHPARGAGVQSRGARRCGWPTPASGAPSPSPPNTMAGRGVDIKLADGVPTSAASTCSGPSGANPTGSTTSSAGRFGRQGDPGESRFYLSAQDEVIRLFAGERVYKILDSRFGPPTASPSRPRCSRARSRAPEEGRGVPLREPQERRQVRRRHERAAKQVYATRRGWPQGRDLREILVDRSEDQPGWIEQVIEAAVAAHTESEFGEDWDWEGMWVALHSLFPMRIGLDEIDREKITREDLLDRVFRRRRRVLRRREAEWGSELARSVERFITLQVLAPAGASTSTTSTTCARASACAATPRRTRSSSTSSRPS